MGYYRVLPAYAAEGMRMVWIRVRLRVCTPHARYLTFLRVILIKMARAFAEGVIISIIGLERCGFKQNPVRVRVRVCIWDSKPNRLGYACIWDRVRVRVRVSRDRIMLGVMFRVRMVRVRVGVMVRVRVRVRVRFGVRVRVRRVMVMVRIRIRVRVRVRQGKGKGK